MSTQPDHADVIAPPPLLYALPLLLGWGLGKVFPLPFFSRKVAWSVGAVLVFLSAALTLGGIRAFARARTSLVPIKPTTAIVTDGPFRFTRNPLYLALALLDSGVAFWTRSFWALLLLIPALWIIQKGVIEREERYLERKFGQEYRSYRSTVRRWI